MTCTAIALALGLICAPDPTPPVSLLTMHSAPVSAPAPVVAKPWVFIPGAHYPFGFDPDKPACGSGVVGNCVDY